MLPDPLADLPHDPALWGDAIGALPPIRIAAVGGALLREWVEGRLEPALIGDEVDPPTLAVLRRSLHAALRAAGYPDDDAWFETNDVNVDESTARRWCWIPTWCLLSQDEDLFLMDRHLAEPLLEEAALGCPKARYARAIVAHGFRDSVFAALAHGWPAVRDRLRSSAAFEPVARQHGAVDLADYLARLGTWERASPVDRDGAVARVRDVWRCADPLGVQLRLEGRQWRAPYPRGGAIVVDSADGAMWFERKA